MAYFIGKAGQAQIVKNIEQRLAQFQFEVVTTAWSKLVLMDSPGIVAPVVLTGRYRSNWVIGVGTPNLSTPGKGGTAAAPTPAPTEPPLPAMQVGQTVWITNSLPYTRDIERGRSKKAPQGVVGPVVAELKQDLGTIVQAINAGGGGP